MWDVGVCVRARTHAHTHTHTYTHTRIIPIISLCIGMTDREEWPRFHRGRSAAVCSLSAPGALLLRSILSSFPHSCSPPLVPHLPHVPNASSALCSLTSDPDIYLSIYLSVCEFTCGQLGATLKITGLQKSVQVIFWLLTSSYLRSHSPLCGSQKVHRPALDSCVWASRPRRLRGQSVSAGAIQFAVMCC